jgi:hypothetical protein
MRGKKEKVKFCCAPHSENALFPADLYKYRGVKADYDMPAAV